MASPASSGVLRVVLDHDVKSGTLTIWVDGRRSLTRRLSSRTRRTVDASLRLRPGPREIRVEVRWNGRAKSARTKTTVATNVTRRLNARLRDGSLSVDWE